MYCGSAGICLLKCSDVFPPWAETAFFLPGFCRKTSLSTEGGWRGAGRTGTELSCGFAEQLLKTFLAIAQFLAVASALLLISFLLGFPRV